MTKRIPRVGGRRIYPVDRNTGGLSLPRYTVATVPSASARTGQEIYVSDGTSNKRVAVSDGTAWRFPDGAVVS